MKKAKTPRAPDYTALANQQAAQAKQNWQEQLTASRPDQTGPEGSLDWTKDPVTGEWSQSVSMAPERQQLYNLTNQKAQEQLSGYDTGQVDLSGAPAMPDTVTAPNEQVMSTIRALRAPEIARRENAARARLAAQGVSGGERIVGTTEQNLADAASRADLDAILAGYGQSNTAFGQGVQRHQIGTGDILAQEQANQAKMAGMMGQSNAFRMPTFAGVATPGMPGAATPDTMGAAQAQYQAAVERANAKNASSPWNQIIGIGSKLAGAYLGGPAGAAIGDKIGGMITGGPEQLGGTNY